MNTKSICLSLALCCFAGACSDAPSPTDSPAAAASGESAPARQPTPATTPVLDGHELDRAIQDPIDRARAVEGQLLQDAAKIDEQVQDQSD